MYPQTGPQRPFPLSGTTKMLSPVLSTDIKTGNICLAIGFFNSLLSSMANTLAGTRSITSPELLIPMAVLIYLAYTAGTCFLGIPVVGTFTDARIFCIFSMRILSSWKGFSVTATKVSETAITTTITTE